MTISVWVDEGVKSYPTATGWDDSGGFLTIWSGDVELAEYAPGWRGVWREETDADPGK